MLDKLAPYLEISYPELFASLAIDTSLSDEAKKRNIQILLDKKVDPSKALNRAINKHDSSSANNMNIVEYILNEAPNTAIDDNAIHSCLKNTKILKLVVEKSPRIKKDIRNYISNNILYSECVNPNKYEKLKKLDLFVLPRLETLLKKTNTFSPIDPVFKEYEKKYSELPESDKTLLKKLIIQHACSSISNYEYTQDLKNIAQSDPTFEKELNTDLYKKLVEQAKKHDAFFIPVAKKIYAAQKIEEEKTQDLYKELLSNFNASKNRNHREKKIRDNYNKPLGFSNILELVELSKIPLAKDHENTIVNKITRIYTYAANKLFIRKKLFDRSLAIYKDALSLQQTLLTDNPDNAPIDLTPLEKKIFVEHCLLACLFPCRNIVITDANGKKSTYRTHILNSTSYVQKMCKLIKTMDPMFVDRLSEEGGKPYECAEQENKNFSGRFRWNSDFAGEIHSRSSFPNQIAADLRPLEATLLNRWWVYGIPRTPNLSLLFTTLIPGLSIFSGSLEIAVGGIMLYVACWQNRSR